MDSDPFLTAERGSAPSAAAMSAAYTSSSSPASVKSPLPVDKDFFRDEHNGMRTPTRSGSPSSSSSHSDDLDIFPRPTFSNPPSPPRPGQHRLEQLFAQIPFPPPRQLASTFTKTDDGEHWRLTFNDENTQHRKALTSIAGSSRCLWPPDSTFLTMTSTFKERAYQCSTTPQETQHTKDAIEQKASLFPYSSFTTASTGSQKNHPRSESFQDTEKRLMDWQPCRKARRVMDGPYFKERNRRMVAGHVRKLIQEAVEDGVGELDLSYLELTDLPSDICDLNFAIVYNERGSFSLSKNRLKLFLSCNRFSTIPMDVFTLHNLSVLSLRNNSIEAIPPEIGLLHNLIELSLGGNQLKVLPSQISLLPKLQILTVHPNPLLEPPETVLALSTVEQGNIPEGQYGAQQDGDHAPVGPISLPTTPSPSSTQEDIYMFPANDQAGPSHAATSSTPAFDPESAEEESEIFVSSQSSTVTTGTLESTTSSIQSTASSMTSDLSRDSPPHKVLKSRIPTLLILAGNAMLNHMDAHGATGVGKTGGSAMDRSRKDSKISMDGYECSREDTTMLKSRPCSDREGGSSLAENSAKRPLQATATTPAAAVEARNQFRFDEATIKSYLTPYMFDIYKRASINNRCQGCHQKFWKPCRTVVVWQDLLGQTKVPMEWKGCGIGACKGVPASVLSPTSLDTTSAAEPARATSSTDLP
ncbi:hypothetical protein BGZ75_009005 [Mortierella antarctica]|nr:hypothetical protein BGZ75_009005 [Mortierella antarctica]